MPIEYDITTDALYLEGIEKGVEKGIEQGIEQGIQKGIVQGVEKAILKLLLSNKLSEAEIADIMGVGVDKIKEVKRKLDK